MVVPWMVGWPVGLSVSPINAESYISMPLSEQLCKINATFLTGWRKVLMVHN